MLEDDVAASQLAIDGQIEHRKIACSPLDLQLAAISTKRVWAEAAASPVSLPLSAHSIIDDPALRC